MKRSQRKNIIRKVNKRIKQNIGNVFNTFDVGRKEQIHDQYIETVCKEKGFTISEFYATDSKELDPLLSLEF